MKKIIWISSYPKSGNTWVRYLLGNYFYNKSKIHTFNISKYINQFPPKEILEKYLTADILKQNPQLIAKYWIKIQEDLIKLDQNPIFFKNHSALLNIEGNNFTNALVSIAAIYLIRDPRDVVISYANFTNRSYDEIIERMCSNKLYNTFIRNDFSKISFIGSWKFNYISWRDGIPNIPRIIIKYEDLLKNTKTQFLKILNFLNNKISFIVDNELIDYSIEESSFKKLQIKEINKIFKENNSNNKSLFFREGRSLQWKEKLNVEQIKKIEYSFKKEMQELNYL